jgi:hypothetical protein
LKKESSYSRKVVPRSFHHQRFFTLSKRKGLPHPLVEAELRDACGTGARLVYTRKKPSRIGLATRAGTGFTTSLLVSGQIALEISSGRDFLCGYRETDTVITMARFRTLSARRNAMISAAQCRSARALLGWSVAKLASAASVSASAIDDFEAERRAPIPAVAGSNARCSRNLMSRQSRPHAPGDLGMSVVLPRRIIA